MAPIDPSLGDVVEVPAGRGVVRFSGATSFSAGKWIGIELYEPKGKNDGTVQGVRYFTCHMSYGVFVRPSQVKVVSITPDILPLPPRAQPQATLPLPTSGRPGHGHQRTNSSGMARVAATARSVASRSASPARAATTGHGLGSTVSTPAINRARLGSPTKRSPSISIRTPQGGLPRNASFTSEAASPTVSRFEVAQSQEQVNKPIPALNPFSPSTSHTTPAHLSASSLRNTSSPSPEPFLDASLVVTPEETSPQPSTPELPLPPLLDDTELQELRAKIRVLEAKRGDDTRHIRELETRLNEAESFVALRPKLQAKLNQLQTELIVTKRELADTQQLSSLSDNRIVDAQEQLEMAMLDKEVAEERAELAEAELEEAKEKLAVLEVELQVLREGGGGEDGDESAVKHSLAYIQLEKQNERLKEALIRLRDMSQETDLEQRKRIAEMENDVISLDEIQSQYESTLIKLSNAEVQIEDLKLQLDDALGAEEMLVQLTERNLMLGEKIEEMRITIEDLEALKELSDELEENHVDTEKALQEDLNTKDVEIREYTRKIQSLEDACQDLEGTIVQFRELVLQLQSELDSLRAETQNAQHESATAASQHAAVMSMNLKLQSSVTKNQARNIDFELKRIEAKEARELLSIIQPYLPQIYVESDTDSTSCYLLFRRLSAKIEMLNTFVAQAHNLPDTLNGPVSEALVGICEMRGRLSALSITSQRFAAILRRCDVESFLNIGRIFPDVAPMEKRIDMHIDLLRREEFRVYECVSDAVKMQSQFDHLSETYFNGYDFDLSERELGYALSFDYDLEMFSASVGLIKTSVSAVMKDDDLEMDLGGLNAESEFFEPLQRLLDQCRGVKVLTKKLTKRIEDLGQDSAALKAHLVPQLQALTNDVPELVNFGFSLAQQVMPHLSEVRSSKAPFSLNTVLGYLKDCAANTVGKNAKELGSWDAVGEFFTNFGKELNRLVPLAMENENVVKITGIAPWVTRVEEIKSATAINVEAERKVAQLNDEMQALVRTLKAKDQHIQEASVKIEHMERRIETVKKQADQISDLETELQKSRKQEKAYEDAIEQLHVEMDTLGKENTKLKATTSGPDKQSSAVTQPVEQDNIQVEGNLETSYLLEQIDAFRGTVRYLRNENSYLKGQDLLREIESLPIIPEPQPFSREPTPPLVPSTVFDSDSDLDDSPPLALRTLAAESKLLYRDVIRYAAEPKMVDLSVLRRKRQVEEGGEKHGRPWMPRKKTPAHQVWERRMEGERLGKKVASLKERTSLLASIGAARREALR